MTLATLLNRCCVVRCSCVFGLTLHSACTSPRANLSAATQLWVTRPSDDESNSGPAASLLLVQLYGFTPPRTTATPTPP